MDAASARLAGRIRIVRQFLAKLSPPLGFFPIASARKTLAQIRT
jgi:hypothetical protein